MTNMQSSLLQIVRYQLFGGEKPTVPDSDILEIMEEAKLQTVFPTVFPFLQNALKAMLPEQFIKEREYFFTHVMSNTNNFQEHGELHRLMKTNGIAYSTLKGIASAYYYPDPSLREMGDVDFLVYQKDFQRAAQVVSDSGFTFDHGGDDGIHMAFTRYPLSTWEMHRCVNGVPGGDVGRLIQKEIDTIISSAERITLEDTVCFIPDPFHHGLIMLLHMISHMTSEGIGLRHLCDWAVFVNSLQEGEFAKLFSEKLRSFGIWRFAQTMTLVCERYLGIRHQEWAETCRMTDAQLEEVIADIYSGGNFGKKDLNRYREIKYISNRGKRTVDNKNVVAQVAGTLNQKVYADYDFIRRHKILLPAGWVAEGGRYIGLLLTGKRKSRNTSAMLREAAGRKQLYSRMRLFESEDK